MVATAGHVDHGKSSLIEALTGVHPDRLKEEQERQMTIDLGFGWLTLPDGREIGLVDVPGHNDFIENMVAGVSGIDAALLVIAADEGVRPQTREHLVILDLLGVRTGVIALSKADLVAEDDWWRVLEAEVKALTNDTFLQEAPMVRVSARDRRGLAELLEKLAVQLSIRSARPELGRPRLPVDRVFTMEGFGTVVTGTLADGQLSLGDEVELQPAGLRGRVRGLQHHRRSVRVAEPGSRTAVNVSGLEASQLQRGNVLTHPGAYRPTRRLDAKLRVLPEASANLAHDVAVKLFLGTTQSMATMRLLGGNGLAPGDTGLVQFELARPVVCAEGDAFILRKPSPAETIGGGIILDAHPAGRHRRFDAVVLQSLASRSDGATTETLFAVIQGAGVAPLRQIIAMSRLPESAARHALSELLDQGRIAMLGPATDAPAEERMVITSADWDALSGKLLSLTRAHHAKFPLRPGIPREELKNQLRVDQRTFAGAIARHVADGNIVIRGHAVALADHGVRFSPQQQVAVDVLLARFRANPAAPPTIKECKAVIGEELFVALRETGQLVAVSDEIVFLREAYERAVAAIRVALLNTGQISLAQVRDLLKTSRKYSQALLEHMDTIGVTRREGDIRVLQN